MHCKLIFIYPDLIIPLPMSSIFWHSLISELISKRQMLVLDLFILYYNKHKHPDQMGEHHLRLLQIVWFNVPENKMIQRHLWWAFHHLPAHTTICKSIVLAALFFSTGALAVMRVLLTFALDCAAICECDEVFSCEPPHAVPRVGVVYNTPPHPFSLPLPEILCLSACLWFFMQ